MKPFSAGLKKARLLFLSFFMALITAMMIWLPFYMSTHYSGIRLYRSITIENGSIPMFLLYLLFAFFAFYLAVAIVGSVIAVFTKGDVITVDAKGIYNDAGAGAPGLIPWENMRFISFYEVNGQPLIRIEVADPAAVKAEMPWYKKFLNLGAKSFSIGVKNINCEPKALYDAVISWSALYNKANKPVWEENEEPDDMIDASSVGEDARFEGSEEEQVGNPVFGASVANSASPVSETFAEPSWTGSDSPIQEHSSMSNLMRIVLALALLGAGGFLVYKLFGQDSKNSPVVEPGMTYDKGEKEDQGTFYSDSYPIQGFPNGEASYQVLEKVSEVREIRYVETWGKTVQYDISEKHPSAFDKRYDKGNLAIATAAETLIEQFYRVCAPESMPYLPGPGGLSGVPEGTDGLITFENSYEIGVANDQFMSVKFDEHFCLGSYYGEYVNVRTVNVNLVTGETFQLSDVLVLDDELAQFWMSAFKASTDDRTFDMLLRLYGGDEGLTQAFKLGIANGQSLLTSLYVDASGQVYIYCTFVASGDAGVYRGTDGFAIAQGIIDSHLKESEFWTISQAHGTE